MQQKMSKLMASEANPNFLSSLAACLVISAAGTYYFSLVSGEHGAFAGDWDRRFFVASCIGLAVTLLLLVNWRLRQPVSRALAKSSQEDYALRFSRRDPITGLASYHILNEALAWRIVESRDVTLMLIKLSDFDKILAAKGYEIGNELLQRVGKRLVDLKFDPSCQVGRLDGSTFALVLATVDKSQLETTSLVISRSLSQAYDAAGESFDIKTRIGIATTGRGQVTSNELIRMAQVALQQASSEAGQQWCYYDVNQEAPRLLLDQMRADLPAAIESGEIVPFYQPIVDLKTRTWVKLEVLARWHHPTLGWLNPDQFIPIAESLQLTGAITKSLLEQVASDATSFPPHLIFGFNASPEQLRSILKFSGLANVGGGASLPGSRIEVEITERALTENLDVAREVIRTLQAAGTKVVLDDFGMGSSNFFHLCELPFDSIKIDKKFVLGMLHDRRAAACVGAMMLTGRSLGIEMVASGIEDSRVVSALVDLGCRYGQGFLFGRPTSAVNIRHAIAKHLVIA